MAYSGLVMLVFATLMGLSSARVVNISNTWMLPEEGFPVFYRYFRDRISWYEADAVCQFHHANLVTADSSSEYDAIRAYLKELDITENVWIGLSKASDKPNFTWTDFQPLNGEGHWQEAIRKLSDAMCVAMEPTADFLWKAMPCGGPEVASFICELPIPSWALGIRGCLLTELPSLTVLYIPEQSAVELTSDCGLDGTKRIACKGNANREEILKQLTCAISHDDFDEKSTKSPTASSIIYETSSDENSLIGKTTKTWIWTSNTVDIDYGMPTRHRRETENTLNPVSTKSTVGISTTRGSYQMKAVMSESSTTSTINYYKTEVTTDILENDSTLDLGVPTVADKSTEISKTKRGLISQRPRAQEQASTASLSTADSRITVTDIDETTAEYPSAINQDRLFSIIENGTTFDVIEINNSNPDAKSKTKQRKITSALKNDANVITAHTLTNVKYSLENIPNNKGKAKPVKKLTKKEMYQEFEQKKSTSEILPKAYVKSEDSQKDELTKEVELYPIIKDTSLKLNRTFRKELPPILEGSDLINDSDKISKATLINLLINNDLSNPENEHVEIKLQEGGRNNITKTLFITASKRNNYEHSRKNISSATEMPKNQTELINTMTNKTNSTVDIISLKFSNKKNKKNETVMPQIGQNSDSMLEMKKLFLPKSLLTASGTTDMSIKYIESSVSQNPLDVEPAEQPRPNRQRQLTRPQRRSFYPYFFSRVLG